MAFYYCSVFSCNSKGTPGSTLKFFQIPYVASQDNTFFSKTKLKRSKAWIEAIHRKDLTTPTKIPGKRVCALHFQSGKPAEWYDIQNPDWIPNKNLGYTPRKYYLDSLRNCTQNQNLVFKNISESTNKSSNEEFNAETTIRFSNDDEILTKEVQTDINLSQMIALEEDFRKLTISQDTIVELKKKLNMQEKQIIELNNKLINFENNQESFENDDERTNFFTGVSTYAVLNSIFIELDPYLPKNVHCKLNTFQMFILTPMKLRLGLSFKDLGYRFCVTTSTASRYFHKVLFVMYAKLRCFVIWPERDALRKTMPEIFKQKIGHNKIVTIIDCFEVFTEHPSRSLANSQCWSNYKHHETIKVLIGITPTGTISFISNAYGGRCSDKFIVNDCGILNLLLPGDVVFADRGFLSELSVAMCGAELVTPTFVKGLNQLHPRDVEQTRKMASLRIHVERIIGMLRQKYQILANTLPISVIEKTVHSIPVIDQILTVSSALENLCEPIIKQNNME